MMFYNSLTKMNKRILYFFRHCGIQITPEIENLVKQLGNPPISNKELLERIRLLNEPDLFTDDDDELDFEYKSAKFANGYPHFEKLFIQIWIQIHNIKLYMNETSTYVYVNREMNEINIIYSSNEIFVNMYDQDRHHCPGPILSLRIQ